MREAWILELLGSARDAARARAMPRLAEHLDDAILVAASEFHEAGLMAEACAGDDVEGASAAGGVARSRIH